MLFNPCYGVMMGFLPYAAAIGLLGFGSHAVAHSIVNGILIDGE
jgi:hypothetical protein